MTKKSILLVEDNTMIQKIVNAAIGCLCELKCVDTIAKAEQELKANAFSLIILDVGLPDGDGFSFCKQLRGNEGLQHTPIVFLTGQTEVDDRVQGFSLGADDYIVKPIEPKEFTARIVAKLNRQPKTQLQPSFRAANFFADLVAQKMTIERAGKQEELNLTPIEFKLLVNFLQNEGKIFNKKDLVGLIWGNSVHISEHTVDTHISTLRKKIGESSRFIRTVLKKGYCFTTQDDPKA